MYNRKNKETREEVQEAILNHKLDALMRANGVDGYLMNLEPSPVELLEEWGIKGKIQYLFDTKCETTNKAWTSRTKAWVRTLTFEEVNSTECVLSEAYYRGERRMEIPVYRVIGVITDEEGYLLNTRSSLKEQINTFFEGRITEEFATWAIKSYFSYYNEEPNWNEA